MIAAGTSAATFGSAAGVLADEAVPEVGLEADGGTALEPAFLVAEDELLLLPHPARAATQSSESGATNQLLLHVRI
ncbi:MAG: hypothetical protein M3Z06_09325 [Actinomycetota bacterium]|nr:hypothetical protein [Actinomycetota bacterium]